MNVSQGEYVENEREREISGVDMGNLAFEHFNFKRAEK